LAVIVAMLLMLGGAALSLVRLLVPASSWVWPPMAC
jgi:hypothetical protein